MGPSQEHPGPDVVRDDPVGRDLVNRARRGDAAAFHELVDRYGGRLYGLALSLVGNAADAEDVLQETFSGAFRYLSRFRHEASVETWLHGILVRQAALCHRRRAKHKTVPLTTEEEGPGETPREVAGRSSARGPDVRMDVMAALESLSDDHRVVLVLRELQGMSYAEIAAALELPAGTVESRLFRARQALKERLKDYL